MTQADSHARKFHSLEGLRALGATAVVVYHSPAFFRPLAAPGAALALDLFFMISGVVVCAAYEHRLAAGMSTSEFMRIRLIRLFPLCMLGAAFATVVTVASLFMGNLEHWDGAHLSLSVVLTFLMVPNPRGWGNEFLFPLNVPYWSLFYELAANLLYAAFLMVLTTRRLVVIAACAAIALLALIARSGTVDQGSTAAAVLPAIVRVVFGFSTGVLLARRLRHFERQESNLAFVVIIGIAAILTMARPGAGYGAYWDAVGVLLVCPALVYFGIRFTPSSGLQSAAASLGLASYAVYVLHSPLSAVLNSAIRLPFFNSVPMRGAPYVGMIECFLLFMGGLVIDLVCDRPARKWLGRVVPKPLPPPRDAHA